MLDGVDRGRIDGPASEDIRPGIEAIRRLQAEASLGEEDRFGQMPVSKSDRTVTVDISHPRGEKHRRLRSHYAARGGGGGQSGACRRDKLPPSGRSRLCPTHGSHNRCLSTMLS